MHEPESDALLIFDSSGDLAYRKIIPSIYSLVRRGRLAAPVIGVARDSWTLERLRERLSASLREHNGDLDESAIAALALADDVGGWQDPGIGC
jgi:glucose-6-phosphate 1-dehydrogenase